MNLHILKNNACIYIYYLQCYYAVLSWILNEFMIVLIDWPEVQADLSLWLTQFYFNLIFFPIFTAFIVKTWAVA